jgi:hypothetical protein
MRHRFSLKVLYSLLVVLEVTHNSLIKWESDSPSKSYILVPQRDKTLTRTSNLMNTDSPSKSYTLWRTRTNLSQRQTHYWTSDSLSKSYTLSSPLIKLDTTEDTRFNPDSPQSPILLWWNNSCRVTLLIINGIRFPFKVLYFHAQTRIIHNQQIPSRTLDSPSKSYTFSNTNSTRQENESTYLVQILPRSPILFP